uniref:RNase_Zc3h12a domain-containing protein n=1 Tax=Strongyloides papillosus TaxID=174720 RepID=A0A0N5BFA6_STREA
MLKTSYLWIFLLIFIGHRNDNPMKITSQLDFTWFFVLFFGVLIFIRNLLINSSTKKDNKIETSTIRQLCSKGQICMLSTELKQSNVNENEFKFSTFVKGYNGSNKNSLNFKNDCFSNLKITDNKKANCFKEHKDNDMTFISTITKSRVKIILLNLRINNSSYEDRTKLSTLSKGLRLPGISNIMKILNIRNKIVACIPKKLYIFFLKKFRKNISNIAKKKELCKLRWKNFNRIVFTRKKNLNTKNDAKKRLICDVSSTEEEELTNSGTESYADIELMESFTTNIENKDSLKVNNIISNKYLVNGDWITSNYMLNLSTLSNWIITKCSEIQKCQPYILKLQGHMETDRNDIKKMLKLSSGESINDLSTISSTDSYHPVHKKFHDNFKVDYTSLNVLDYSNSTESRYYMEKILNQRKIDIDFFDNIIKTWNGDDEVTLLASAFYKFKDIEIPSSRLEHIKNISDILAKRRENNKIQINEYVFKILLKQLNSLILSDPRITNKKMKKDFGKRLKNMWSAKCFKKILFSGRETLFVLPSEYIRHILESMTKSERKALKYYKNTIKKKSKNSNRCTKLSFNLRNACITVNREKPIEEMICDGFYKCLGIKRQLNMSGFYELRKDQFAKIIVSIICHHLWNFLPLQRCDFENFMKSKELDDMMTKINNDLTTFLSKFVYRDSIPDIISTFDSRLISCLNDFLLSNQMLNEDFITRKILRRSNAILKVSRISSTKRRNTSLLEIKRRKSLLLKKGHCAYKKYKNLKNKLKRPVQSSCNVLADSDKFIKDCWLDSEKHGKELSNISSQKSSEPRSHKIFEKIDSTFSTSSFSSRSTVNSSDTNSQGIRYLNDGEFIINPERSIYSACYKHDGYKKNWNFYSNDKIDGQLYSVAIDECDKIVIERNSDTLFRPVYINGVEAGYSMQSKKGDVLCVRGITITLNYFLSRGHQVQAFLPSVYKHHPDRCDNYDELLSLYEMNLIEFTQEYGADKYVEVNCQILQRAIEFGGCIVARSQMHVIVDERSIFSKVVEERLLMPTFCDEDIFFPLDGPLGRLGNSFNDTLLCRKYEEDWDRVRLQQLQFRDQKIWLFALAYLLESDKWFRQAEFLEGYYAKPLSLPPANVSSYLINSAKYYQPHPPETCTRSSRGYRLIKVQKKSSNDYRLVRNRIITTDICLDEHHKLLQNELTEFMNDPLIKKLFKQKITDKIPSYVFSEFKGFRLFNKINEKKISSQEEQRIRTLYTINNTSKDRIIANDVLSSTDVVDYNWKNLHEYKHLLNSNN